ncbi:putative mitochondrial solute carrier [Danaus plexippus plexippus]|uniref:Mitochondrial solute carrier n=1 Tax=Danaus plexippus plexippus TaxID=278856 RepID=A0A212FFJ3_DANPL|nr:putative mitochondrial solute carrier [Danaus plexippus plexippus]
MTYVTLKGSNMKYTTILLLILISKCHCDQISDTESYLSRFIADMWLEGSDIVRIIWRDCSRKLVDVKDTIDHKENFPKFVRCMKRKTLRALDRSLNPDVVPIADGINFVRFEIVDPAGNLLPENNTSFWTEKELEEGEWRHLALQRMAKIFRTHVIKFDLDDNFINKAEFRGRRRHHLMTMMIFGVVSIGMVIIPMGFQFLAVLGGKALLLAKMALILASIQGLKKVTDVLFQIAASPLSYGFYHSYPFDHYDKRGLSEPSSVQKPPFPSFNLEDHIKIDRVLRDPDVKLIENEKETGKFDVSEQVKHKEKQLPVQEDITMPPSVTPLVNDPSHHLTGLGEVQADYALDLPYNGLHFQSSDPVISPRHV